MLKVHGAMATIVDTAFVRLERLWMNVLHMVKCTVSITLCLRRFLQKEEKQECSHHHPHLMHHIFNLKLRLYQSSFQDLAK